MIFFSRNSWVVPGGHADEFGASSRAIKNHGVPFRSSPSSLNCVWHLVDSSVCLTELDVNCCVQGLAVYLWQSDYVWGTSPLSLCLHRLLRVRCTMSSTAAQVSQAILILYPATSSHRHYTASIRISQRCPS